MNAVPTNKLTSARDPDASAGRASGTSTTTGYTGLLDVADPCPVPALWVVVLPADVPEVGVDVDGRRLMEVTDPGTELVAPCGVTLAFWPTCTEAIEASGTLTVTSTAPLPTMTMLRPELEVPVTRVTEPTVPAMEDFIVAEVRLVWALLSAPSAVVTAAWSEMTREAPD